MDTDPPVGDGADSGALFEQLAAIVYAKADYDEVYRAICTSAPRLVDGCDHASLIVRQNDRFVTVAVSDDVAKDVDDLERAYRQGPCLDAIVDETPQLEPDLASMSQWSLFARSIVHRTPVRGAAGFRMIIENNKVGALNLFADRPGALTKQSANQGIILASFASVVISAVTRKDTADMLAEGLKGNREIGKAVGLLMALHKVSDAAAFDLLRQASQDMNVKIAEIARELVSHHNTGRGYSGEPAAE